MTTATAPSRVPLQWSWLRFNDLGVDGVYDMLALRAKIFILEQGPYLDPDGLTAMPGTCSGGGTTTSDLRAYLRLVDPGLKFDEPSIGRVVLDEFLRGTGTADELMVEGVARCVVAWPGLGCRISAQAHLQRFYSRHGSVTVGRAPPEAISPCADVAGSPMSPSSTLACRTFRGLDSI